MLIHFNAYLTIGKLKLRDKKYHIEQMQPQQKDTQAF